MSTKINHILLDGLKTLLEEYKQRRDELLAVQYTKPLATLECNDLKITIKQLEAAIEGLEMPNAK